ncbi:hypothetical protein F4779DRAFT_547954 [Xylariaceae sp. FL0662B]|nr:hypothetical protein F4779DRAFT_547954 [Xylariaceae sp. FL0662B]
MTRKLPWKHAEASPAATPKPAQSTPIRPSPKNKDNESNIGDNSSVPSTNKRQTRTSSSRRNRSISTSPPPQPLPETFMIDGLENDDLYRMVEDEFLSTAQLFTAHLHAAEYHRLKAVSKSQNADTIRDISRPVIGRMTDLVKMKQERKARLEKQRQATKRALANKKRSSAEFDNTDDEDDPWERATLFGLMESPRKQATRLDTLTTTAPATRAAAGFGGATPRRLFTTAHPATSGFEGHRHQSRLSQDSTGSEDKGGQFDSPVLRFTSTPARNAAGSTSRLHEPRQIQTVPGGRQLPGHPAGITKQSKQAAESKSAEEGDSSDGSGEDLLSRLKRRQEQRRRSRERRKQAASKARSSDLAEDIIPGFL